MIWRNPHCVGHLKNRRTNYKIKIKYSTYLCKCEIIHSSKSTGKETGKTHLCAVEEGRGWRLPAASSLNVYTVSAAIHSSTL